MSANRQHLACGVVWALVLNATLLFCAPACAYADEGLDGADNAVNTQQLPDSSFIYDTSIIDLGAADSYYDNQIVQVTGEVVGDSIQAGLGGRHRWITLEADNAAATLAVYMSNEAAAKIDTFGSYGAKGTMLQVRGTYHLVCADHEGLSDLHAEVVTVVERGVHREDRFDIKAFIPGMMGIGLGLILLVAFYWLRERQR